VRDLGNTQVRVGEVGCEEREQKEIMVNLYGIVGGDQDGGNQTSLHQNANPGSMWRYGLGFRKSWDFWTQKDECGWSKSFSLVSPVQLAPATTPSKKHLVRKSSWNFMKCAYMMVTFFFVSYNKGDWVRKCGLPLSLGCLSIYRGRR
jgi:hypothetical protein